MYQAVASSNLAFCAKGNAVVLYLISLVSKPAVKRYNDRSNYYHYQGLCGNCTTFINY